jgi:hypothetical protein
LILVKFQTLQTQFNQIKLYGITKNSQLVLRNNLYLSLCLTIRLLIRVIFCIDSKKQDLIVCDLGNSSPKLFRASTYAFPETPGLATKCKIPVGVVVQPFAPQEECVPSCEYDPLRCHVCGGFLNPWCKLVQGSSWNCNLCGSINDGRVIL